MHHKNNGLANQRTIPICFSSDTLKILEEYAKTNGLLDYSQALEHLIKKTLEK
jgi:hypothetical protein